MTIIDLHNYEAFLLDYSEGHLAANDIAVLKAFILSYPELEIDLNDFELPYLTQEEHTADFKTSLKKGEEVFPDEELLNYLEGNLSLTQSLDFEKRLACDKTLAANLEAYKKTILSPPIQELADFKNSLYRTEDDLVLNNTLIAYHEKQLTALEALALEKELRLNPLLQKEFGLISKTVLSADPAIVYPDKEALKKENKVIALFSIRTIGSMAAAVLLLIGLAFIYNYSTSKAKVEGGLARLPVLSKTNESTKQAPVESLTPKQQASYKEVQALLADKKMNTVNTKIKDVIKTSIEQETPTKVQEEVAPLPIANAHQKESPVVSEDQKSELASNSKPENLSDSITNKQNYLLVAEELVDYSDPVDTKASKQKGFWKRAVQLAKQANKLGVKSIDGQENSENKYRLSFNSFSVGKK